MKELLLQIRAQLKSTQKLEITSSRESLVFKIKDWSMEKEVTFMITYDFLLNVADQHIKLFVTNAFISAMKKIYE